MEYRIEKLNQYLVGWCGYFALANTHSIFKTLDSWIKRRLRMCLWKNWKKPRTRVRNLIRLKVHYGKAKGWKVCEFVTKLCVIHLSWTAVYGTVGTVVVCCARHIGDEGRSLGGDWIRQIHQTALSCCNKELWWWASREGKRVEINQSCEIYKDERKWTAEEISIT